MSLKLFFHPLSSFCQKVLVALYENDTPFEPFLVDLGDETSLEQFTKIWPIGKFPVLRDEGKEETIPESSIIIEYLARHYPGRTQLLPPDADLARQTRLRDRFFDLYVNVPMQKIVTDRLRPSGKNDAYGVEQARATLRTACGMLDQEMGTKTWAMGEAFTMADCAAAPALFYANMMMPFGKAYKNVAAYLNRLMERPSYARALEEAQPYLARVPR
jgi:glutathione S-transferase